MHELSTSSRYRVFGLPTETTLTALSQGHEKPRASFEVFDSIKGSFTARVQRSEALEDPEESLEDGALFTQRLCAVFGRGEPTKLKEQAQDKNFISGFSDLASSMVNNLIKISIRLFEEPDSIRDVLLALSQHLAHEVHGSDVSLITLAADVFGMSVDESTHDALAPHEKHNISLLIENLVLVLLIGQDDAVLVRKLELALNKELSGKNDRSFPRAAFAWAKGEYGDASDLLTSLCVANPDHAYARVLLGRITLSQNDHARAGTFFEMASVLAPNNYPLGRALVMLLIELQHYGDALTHLEALVERYPNSFQVVRDRCALMIRLGQHDLAEILLSTLEDEVEEEHQSSLQILKYEMDFANGKIEELESFSNESHKLLSQEWIEFLSLRAHASYRNSGYSDETRDALSKLLDMTPMDMATRFSLVDLYTQRQEPANAARTLREMLDFATPVHLLLQGASMARNLMQKDLCTELCQRATDRVVDTELEGEVESITKELLTF